MARVHARDEHAGVGVARRDAIDDLGTPRGPEVARHGEGGPQGRRRVAGRASQRVLQREPQRGHLARARVAHAAVGVQVAQRRARHRRGRVDAHGTRGDVGRQVAHEPAIDQCLQRHAPLRHRLGVWREWITIGGELQRRHAQEPRRPGLVARGAVGARRDGVPDPGANLHAVEDASRRHERRGAVGPPDVARIPPALGRALDHPRFGGLAVEAELLPHLRADRELPCIGIGGVDPGAGGQMQPARLRRAVGPERVHRRVRQVRRGDRLRLPVAVETGLAQRLRQRRHGRRVGAGQRHAHQAGHQHRDGEGEGALHTLTNVDGEGGRTRDRSQESGVRAGKESGSAGEPSRWRRPAAGLESYRSRVPGFLNSCAPVLRS